MQNMLHTHVFLSPPESRRGFKCTDLIFGGREEEGSRARVILNTWFCSRTENDTGRSQPAKLEDKIFVFAFERRVVGFCLESGQLEKEERSTSRRLFQRFRVGIPSPSNVARIIDPRPRNNYTSWHFFILHARGFMLIDIIDISPKATDYNRKYSAII